MASLTKIPAPSSTVLVLFKILEIDWDTFIKSLVTLSNHLESIFKEISTSCDWLKMTGRDFPIPFIPLVICLRIFILDSIDPSATLFIFPLILLTIPLTSFKDSNISPTFGKTADDLLNTMLAFFTRLSNPPCKYSMSLLPLKTASNILEDPFMNIVIFSADFNKASDILLNFSFVIFPSVSP